MLRLAGPGLTASGKHITYNGGHFIAADPKLLPYFTKVIVPGYNNGKPVDVIDRGGAIRDITSTSSCPRTSSRRLGQEVVAGDGVRVRAIPQYQS